MTTPSLDRLAAAALAAWRANDDLAEQLPLGQCVSAVCRGFGVPHNVRQAVYDLAFSQTGRKS